MENKLEQFMKTYRAEMDVLEVPASLWLSIESGINQLPVTPNPAPAKAAWWKSLLFTAVVVTTTGFFYVNKHKATTVASSNIQQQPQVSAKPPAEEQQIIPLDSVDQKNNQKVYAEKTPLPVTSPSAALPASVYQPMAIAPMAEQEQEAPQQEYTNEDENPSSDTTFSGIIELIAEGGFSDISLRQTNSPVLKVTARFDAGKRNDATDYKVVYERSGQSLTISLAYGNSVNSSGCNTPCLKNAVIEIEIPQTTTQVMLKSTSGDIAVNTFKGSSLFIKSISGNQNVRQITARLTMNSSSGDLNINAQNGPASGESISGTQHWTHLNGDANLHSSSGDIYVTNLTGNTAINTISGSQFITGHRGNLVSTSSSGDVELTQSKGIISVRTISGNIYGKGTELTSSAQFNSSSGDINMELLNAPESLSFDLKSLSGDLSIHKGILNVSGSRHLVTGSGPVLIKSSTISGNQQYD